ncbi:ISW2 [Apiospora kogelbergensis]|uniref:ISW2 n=1 Tax=Apiospora kogelbergensis TaxID=1337665 RepID=A0AAW0QB39_9PEZI
MDATDHVEAREMGTDDVDVEAEAEMEMDELANDKETANIDQGETEEDALDGDGDTEMGQNTEAIIETHTAYRLVFSPVISAKFQRIIMDEAHALRNPKSGYSRMMRVFPRKSSILITATPTLNTMSDIHGLLNQIHAFSQLNMSDKAFNPDLLDEDCDFSEVGYDQAAKAPVFNPAATYEDINIVKEFAIKTGKKPWSIFPHYTSRISGDANGASTESDLIYKSGIECVQLRRTMQDSVKILVTTTDEDGVETEVEELKFPGQNIPASVVPMKELSFKGLTPKDEDMHKIYHYTNIILIPKGTITAQSIYHI